MALDLEDQVDNYKQEIMEYRRQLNDQNQRHAYSREFVLFSSFFLFISYSFGIMRL